MLPADLALDPLPEHQVPHKAGGEEGEEAQKSGTLSALCVILVLTLKKQRMFMFEGKYGSPGSPQTCSVDLQQENYRQVKHFKRLYLSLK